MHHVAREVPLDEIWQAMEQLVREGKIIYVGSSNFAGWDIATACQTAARRNFLGLVSRAEQVQPGLPMGRAGGPAGVPALRPGRHSVEPAGRRGAGRRPQEAKEGRRAEPNQRKNIARLEPQLRKYEALCRKLGESPADVALAWLLANPAVTAPIIGPRTIEQLTGSLRALALKLKPDVDGEARRDLARPRRRGAEGVRVVGRVHGQSRFSGMTMLARRPRTR